MAYVDPLRNPKNFLFKTWRYLGLPDPSPLQYDFMEYVNDHRAWKQVEEAARRGDEGARKILMAFRGAAKTYVVTTNGVYRLRENQEEEVLCVSATHGFAGQIASMAYNMITQFDFLAPDMAPSDHQRKSALAFDVRGARPANKDLSFCAEGIFGQITGKRATIIQGDDLETPNTSETETKRAQLRLRTQELGGAIIKPGGDIFLLGTPQNEQTIYKEYAEEKGYELRIYPVKYPRPSEDPKKDELLKYGPRLAPLIANALTANPLLAGTSTEPARFTERDVIQRQVEYGLTEFERQFMLWMDAGAGRQHPLKLRDLTILDISPPNPTSGYKLMLPAEMIRSTLHEHRIRNLQVDSLPGDGYTFGPMKLDVLLPAEEVICWVDPSGDGKDETTWTILAGQAGRVFLLEQGASREGYTDSTLLAIAETCKKWGVQQVQVESNFGQGMFSSLLRPKLTKMDSHAEVIDKRIGKQRKELRIVTTLEPLVTGHRLVINRAVLDQDFSVDYPDVEEHKRRFYRLTFQFTRISKIKGAIKHDDRVDGLAGGCAHFVERMQATLNEAESRGREKALEMELEKVKDNLRAAGRPVLGEETPDPRNAFGRSTGHNPR